MTDDTKTYLTEAELIAHIRAEIERYGSQRNVACAWGVSGQLVNDVIHGHRFPGAKFLAGLGFERVMLYRRKGGPT